MIYCRLSGTGDISRVGGRPLLLVYRTGLLPDPQRSAQIWREAVRQAGLGDLYLVRVETSIDGDEVSPQAIGFDAAVEFAPYWRAVGPQVELSAENGNSPIAADEELNLYDYDNCMAAMLNRQPTDYPLFRGVFPMWDNSSRRKSNPTIFVNASPEKYRFWLSWLIEEAKSKGKAEGNLVFINAWNEWGEGCHLEPDQRHSDDYLQATKEALSGEVDHASLEIFRKALDDKFLVMSKRLEVQEDARLANDRQNCPPVPGNLLNTGFLTWLRKIKNSAGSEFKW